MSQRLPVHMLDPADGSPGQIPTISPDGTAVDWDDPAGGGGGGGGGGGTLLLNYGQGSADVPAGTPLNTIVYMRGPTATTWDFKGLSALPAGWTRRGVTSETFDSTGMTASLTQGQGYDIVVPDGNGSGAFIAEIALVTGSYTSVMQGVALLTTAGEGQGSVAYHSPLACLGVSVTSHAYASSFTSGGGTPAYPMRLRIRKGGSGGTAYWASMSTNGGVTWTTETLRSGPATVDKISIGNIFGAASMKVSSVAYTPSTGVGGLLGWWNGAQIVPF